jgi:hypothetical protein
VPCHHNLATYLDAWINAAGIAAEKKGPLFRAVRKGNKLTENPMAREDILAMIKRRARAAALPYSTCCHTFARLALRPTCKTAGHWNTRSRSLRTSPRARPNCTIAPRMTFHSTKSSESGSKANGSLEQKNTLVVRLRHEPANGPECGRLGREPRPWRCRTRVERRRFGPGICGCIGVSWAKWCTTSPGPAIGMGR